MINLDNLQMISDKFEFKRMTFKPEDYAYILNRQKITTRFNDFLSRGYYQRKKLVEQGFVGVCYTYRIDYSDSAGKNHRSFVLFSLNRSVMVDEGYFLRVIHHIEEAKKHDKSFKMKKFLNYYSLLEAKPKHYELDHTLTEGKRIYLQYIEVVPSLNPSLKVGLNYVIYGPLISKEILYLPEKYLK